MSASVRLLYDAHGIGGRISRPVPRCFPFRIVLTNASSLQLPIPVASGVRFVVKDTPHGPAQAVFVSATTMPHPAGVTGAAVIMGRVLHDEPDSRSEEHTSELQSHSDLVCRLLLEKK